METPTTEQIRAVLDRKGYKFFTSGSYHLNIIGIRSNESASDKFDDQMHVIYRLPHNTEFEHLVAECTTDPGKYWLNNPMNVKGCAIMVPGQYIDAYQIGLHKGEYKALVQRLPILFVRDDDKNSTLDFSLYRDPEKRKVHATLQIIGANIHRASAFKKALNVGMYSAACQVIQDSTKFDTLTDLASLQISSGAGMYFAYTLLEESDFKA